MVKRCKEEEQQRNSTPDDNRGGKSEDEDGIGERDGAGKRRKLGKKGDDSIGHVDVSPAKNKRSSAQGRKEN
jgi:hypothetical protein